MKTIFETDLSEGAGKAGHVAAELARRWNDVLIVATPYDAVLDKKLPRDVSQTLSAFFTDKLHDEATKLRKDGLQVEEHILPDARHTSLADLARREQSRIVIIGPSDDQDTTSNPEDVAERLAEHDPCPTLVVRSPECLEAWSKGERSLRIFVAFDFTKVSEDALLWVRNLQEIGPCEIVVGYVDQPVAEERRLGIWWSPFHPHNPPKVQRILEKELRVLGNKLLGRSDITVCCEPSMGRPHRRLLDMACSEKADLIVCGTHQRNILDRIRHHSVSRALVRYSPINLLCVPHARREPAPARLVTIDRVLVAVDLSEESGNAVRFAYGIVHAGGVVRLFHVAGPFEQLSLTDGYPYSVPASQEDREKAITTAREIINSMTPPDALANGISTEVSVVESRDVAKAICQESERFCADIVCVGAHNDSGFSRFAHGSVAQSVAAQSKRPVLIVHQTPP